MPELPAEENAGARSDGPLPYRDVKPVGAADFYYVNNATFTFIQGRFGEEGLRRYWSDLGRVYQRPVWERWRKGGLPAVAAYWRAFFAHEPGGEAVVHEEADRVVLEVRVCPALRHLRRGGRTILPSFCHHCYFIGEAAAREAGMTARVCGGGGACRQVFAPRGTAAAGKLSPQRLEEIARIAGETEDADARCL